MKIIDILNKKANGTLEDGFKFCYKNKVFTYNKNTDSISFEDSTRELGEKYIEIKEVEHISYNFTKTSYTGIELSKNFETITELLNKQSDKTNELVRAVNKLIKESKEK